MKTMIDFVSKMENITYVENLVEEISSQHDMNSENYGNILVATVEAVNNAILHGNKLDENKKVHISYAVDEGTLVFNVKDEGPGFDYNNIPDPTLPENIEKPHGRGVFLMTKLADEVEFFNNGSEVELKFNLK